MNNWVIITEEGKVWGYHPKSTEYYTDYYNILDMVYNAGCKEDNTWDRPKLLLKDGKIVCENLYSIAYSYGVDKREAVNTAVAKVKEKYKAL